MFRKYLLLGGAALVVGAGIYSCDVQSTGSDQTATSGTGHMRTSIDFRPVGMLARAAEMTPTIAVFKYVSNKGETVLDTVEIGNGQAIHDKEMLAPRLWTVTVTGFDQRGEILYLGSDTFTIFPSKTREVGMKLDARFSTFLANFVVADSMTRFVIKVDNETWGDSSVAIGTRKGDVIKMPHDYLTASPGAGTDHLFSARVYGQPWHIADTLMYSCDTILPVVSGRNDKYILRLHWVGISAPPPGKAIVNVTLGQVGSVEISTIYDDPPPFTE